MSASHQPNKRARVLTARAHTPSTGRPLAVRAVAFGVLAGAALLAVVLAWPRTPAATAAQRVTIDMGGFTPAVLAARAGQPTRVQVVNPDSSAHTDGGGWHQLAIPALGVDAKVGPRSDKTIELPAAAPGEYAFYCDICCGGKENPSMQGVLRVTA